MFVLLQRYIHASPLSLNFIAFLSKNPTVAFANKAQANPGMFAPTNIIKSKTPNLQSPWQGLPVCLNKYRILIHRSVPNGWHKTRSD